MNKEWLSDSQIYKASTFFLIDLIYNGSDALHSALPLYISFLFIFHSR